MRYNIYIDWVGEVDVDGVHVDNYVEFYPDNIEPFKIVRESDQYFHRFGWGEISISNDPDSYALASNNIYRLFDILTLATSIDIDPTTEIRVKYITDSHTLIGYFGINDCDVDYDRKMITVTPTIIDKYTELLESWETEIESFNDLAYSDTEIDLNIETLGTRTIEDWSTVPDLASDYIPSVTPSIGVVASSFVADGELDAYFDNNEPKRGLINIPSNAFKQQPENYFLSDREETLGTIYEQSDFNADSYVWDSGNDYGVADIKTSLDNIVRYPSADDSQLYKSIKTPNLNKQPDTNPLYWEEIEAGEAISKYGDFELSELTIWQKYGTSYMAGFGLFVTLYCSTKFSRDEYNKIDVENPDYPSSGYPYLPPEGSGWHMRAKIKVEGENGHLWTRLPFNGAYTNTWELQDEETNTTGDASEKAWAVRRTTKIFYPSDTVSKTITSTFTLRNFLDYVFQNTNSVFAEKNVYSTFFFNDNESDCPVLADRIGYGLNYLNLSANYLNTLRVFFTKELIPSLSNDSKDNYPKITQRSVIDDLNDLFGNNLYFYMDSDQNLYIEHIYYLDLTYNAVDVTTLLGVERVELDFTESWKYDKTRMFNRVELSTINSSGVDFTDNLITFSKIVSNKRNIDIKKQIETKIFSTDLRYIIENASDLENGLVLISTKNELKPTDDPLISELTVVVANKVGRISGLSQSNGYMALSNLLYDFGRYEGVWTEGELNLATVPFVETSRTKVGTEILLRGAEFDSLFYITNLGVGLLNDGTIDFDQESTTLNLIYRYNSVPNTDGFVLMVQKESDFEGAEEIWFDFGNYET